jgi:hypothetical protein
MENFSLELSQLIQEGFIEWLCMNMLKTPWEHVYGNVAG